jgi:hypothetical protein
MEGIVGTAFSILRIVELAKDFLATAAVNG